MHKIPREQRLRHASKRLRSRPLPAGTPGWGCGQSYLSFGISRYIVKLRNLDWLSVRRRRNGSNLAPGTVLQGPKILGRKHCTSNELKTKAKHLRCFSHRSSCPEEHDFRAACFWATGAKTKVPMQRSRAISSLKSSAEG